MDDAFLVGVLDGLADRHEELQPLADRQVQLIAVLGDGDALDQLHDEVRPAFGRRAGVEDLGDIGMVHQGQGLALRLEAAQDLRGVHARFDDLEGDAAFDRLGLLGHPDGAHAALAQLLQQLVRADAASGAFRKRRQSGGLDLRRSRG